MNLIQRIEPSRSSCRECGQRNGRRCPMHLRVYRVYKRIAEMAIKDAAALQGGTPDVEV